mmetsp:Transcript_64209/g.143500  ORF Transcript_64209/g.143500 Transcript_64209/m.143500 type:complete len:92 (-) Transcript_64209:577-852(-)
MNVFSELSLNEMESWPCPYTSALPSQALHVSLERTNLHICALGAPAGQSGTIKAKEYSVNLLRAPWLPQKYCRNASNHSPNRFCKDPQLHV